MSPGLKPEYEAKFLEVDPATVRAAIGAAEPSYHEPLTLTRRWLFDSPSRALGGQGMWLRVRDHGPAATMTVKRRVTDGIAGIHELEVGVDSSETARRLLEAVGFEEVAYQESRRELWRLGSCQVTLDEWPGLPPFIEIEAGSEATVRAAAERLGLRMADAVFDSVDGVYDRYYPASRALISALRLTFDPLPEPLLERRPRGR